MGGAQLTLLSAGKGKRLVDVLIAPSDTLSGGYSVRVLIATGP